MNIALIQYTALVELFELVALYFVKRAASNAGEFYRVAAAGIYAGTGLVLVQAVKQGGLGVANGLWNAFSNIAGGAIGLWQGEQYTLNQWLGLALGVVSSILLAWH